ncbi:hypothetical protein VIGAN_07178300 [Vigna angularis var. angularis]|uniref:Uncharacterized protein n=1 Tax=Vigna angularis var. angularis TaxID=157739 RepID=A0A0S3SJ65_PHAAN|nr:hypothetical protein VIGAN_07178300 [Vigna angularis var. angularis]
MLKYKLLCVVHVTIERKQVKELLKLVHKVMLKNELFKRLKEEATATEKAGTAKMKKRLQRRYDSMFEQMACATIHYIISYFFSYLFLFINSRLNILILS